MPDMSPRQKIVAVVQARMGSSRLPGKVLMDLNGSTVIEVLLKRLSKSTLIDKIVVATSIESNNKVLIKHIETLGYKVCVGSENDVLRRYVDAAEGAEADIVVRITGDCPLMHRSRCISGRASRRTRIAQLTSAFGG